MSDSSMPQETLLHRYWRQAMGTLFVIAFPAGAGSFNLAYAALNLIDELEEELSVYRPVSEVNRINQSAAETDVWVPTRLFQLLKLCQFLNRETEGGFDAAMGKLINAWGFFQGQPRVPTKEAIDSALNSSGMRNVQLGERDAGLGFVRFAKPGIELNLGSIGKGFAIDEAVSLLRNSGIRSALITGGFSSIYALNTPYDGSPGWLTTIQHPFITDQKKPLVSLYLRNQALCTSAATFKHLIHEGKKLGHILDPRTGWPASGISSATVIAPHASDADALSTAFYVRGVEFASEYCRIHSEVSAILLRDGHEKVEVIDPSNQIRIATEHSLVKTSTLT